jgi:tetratricopeptide (TPR) repeat protein
MNVAYPVIDSIAKEYGWNYTPDPPTAADLLMMVATLKGPQATLSRYAELKKAGTSPPYKIDESTLINLGYHFLSANQNDAAIQIFKQEATDYPKFWNAYDSLGEAYLKAGQKALAIENYEKSVALNPENMSGMEALKKIREEK